MSGLKQFLERRSKGVAKIKAEKEAKKKPASLKEETPNKEKVVEENLNLTDNEFWAISNQFLKESKQSSLSPVEILQHILTQYSPLKIKQFAKRYQELNT